jgi:hypothetical protein
MSSDGIKDEPGFGGSYYCFIRCGISQLVNKEVMLVLDMGFKSHYSSVRCPRC